MKHQGKHQLPTVKVLYENAASNHSSMEESAEKKHLEITKAFCLWEREGGRQETEGRQGREAGEAGRGRERRRKREGERVEGKREAERSEEKGVEKEAGERYDST